MNMIVDEAAIEKHASIDFTIIPAFTSGASISTRAGSFILTQLDDVQPMKVSLCQTNV